MRQAGAEVVEDFGGLTVTGVSEALAVIPRSLVIYRRLVTLARHEHPDVFVPIDFPEINFRLARSMSKMGIPVVYYVCPQVWAWRRGRLGKIKKFSTKALVIFPFEEAIYREAGIPVEFVGHPLIDLTDTECSRVEYLRRHRLNPESPTVALLPGSRPNEVRSILGALIGAMELIARTVPEVQFLVARAPGLDDSLFASLNNELTVTTRPRVVTVEAQTDEVIASSDVVVTASGTATVQTAIHGRPMVIVYRLSPLTYRLVRRFAHVDMVGMVNLIAGKSVAPELLQDNLTAQSVAETVLEFLGDPIRVQDTCSELRKVRDLLGHHGASRRAAEAILRVASSVQNGGGSR
jgi:lipid-A-disaccharide synthase